MDGTIRTRSFTVDRVEYLGAMWSRGVLRWIVTVEALLLVWVWSLPLHGRSQALPQAAILVGLPAILVAIQYSRVRKAVYDPLSAAAFNDPRTIEFSDAGVETRTEGGLSSNVPWRSIVRQERRGRFTLLYTTRLQHLVVPDEAFASEGDRARFEAALRKLR